MVPSLPQQMYLSEAYFEQQLDNKVSYISSEKKLNNLATVLNLWSVPYSLWCDCSNGKCSEYLSPSACCVKRRIEQSFLLIDELRASPCKCYSHRKLQIYYLNQRTYNYRTSVIQAVLTLSKTACLYYYYQRATENLSRALDKPALDALHNDTKTMFGAMFSPTPLGLLPFLAS